MENNRKHLRVNYNSNCTLNHKGIIYRVQLENVSLTGALVNTGNEQMDGLHIGASVDLKFQNNPNLYPNRCSCEVTRIGYSTIGINFKSMTK